MRSSICGSDPARSIQAVPLLLCLGATQAEWFFLQERAALNEARNRVHEPWDRSKIRSIVWALLSLDHLERKSSAKSGPFRSHGVQTEFAFSENSYSFDPDGAGDRDRTGDIQLGKLAAN